MTQHTSGQRATAGGSAEDAIAAIRETYRDEAEVFDRWSWAHHLLTARWRRPLFGEATGTVLDVACGTALNERYLPEECSYTGVDISSEMLRRARADLTDSARTTNLVEMDAQHLSFRADSFDTVISSLSTCTFPEPVAALREMNRVCDPDGRVLLLEHGESSVGPVARFQDWRAEAHFEKHRCRWTQEPMEHVEASPLEVTDASTSFLGMITAIRATPT